MTAAAGHWAATGALFKVLSAPLRVAIIDILTTRPHTVTELVAALNAPQPLISQHLRVLRDHRLVVGVRSGREMTYRIADDHVAHIVRDAALHAGETA